MWQYERSRGSSADSSDFAPTYGTTWDTLSNYKNVAPVNWQKEVFGRKAQFQNHNVSMNGGNAATNFNLSLTANKEDGILLESGFDRKIANFRLDHKVSDNVKAGINMRYLDQAISGMGTTNSGTRTTNRLRHSINYRPFELPGGTIDDFDEDYYLASGGATNPVLLTQAEYRNQKTKATYLTGYININLIKNLTFRSTFGYDNTNIRQSLFYGKITNTARQYASLPIASIGDQRNSTFNNSNTLQYALKKGYHNISVLAGEETVQFSSSTNYVETRYFPADITADKALAWDLVQLQRGPHNLCLHLPRMLPAGFSLYSAGLVIIMRISIFLLLISVRTVLQNLLLRTGHWCSLPALLHGDSQRKDL
jgi:hypothetical protein